MASRGLRGGSLTPAAEIGAGATIRPPYPAAVVLAAMMAAAILAAAFGGSPSPGDLTEAGAMIRVRERHEEPLPAGRYFTRGAGPAALRGVHEIVLTGDASVGNPFDTNVEVTFTPPSGPSAAKSVSAFYDGGNVWRARVYVGETGAWRWRSASPTDALLDGRESTFRAEPSPLPGMLRPHPANPRAWCTDDGRPFVNVSDTAYRLFHGADATMWQEYVNDAAARGITTFRVASLGGWGGTPGVPDDNNYWSWNDPWEGGALPNFARFDLTKFRVTDERLRWILENHPSVQLQMILLGLKGYAEDGTGRWWASLPPQVRQATLRHFLARWAAFPNVFWLIVNDMHSGPDFPLNRAFAREVGRFLAAESPWKHLTSSGPERFSGFVFSGSDDADWCGYAHLEDGDAVGADAMSTYGLESVPMHIFMAEDYYEQDYGSYADPPFFFRWLQWSWLLAGGSSNYGGRFGVIHPYTQTGRADLAWTGAGGTDYTGIPLKGLDSFRLIASYFADRGIDPGLFAPADAWVADADGRAGKLRPKAARRGSDEIVIYHPNAVTSGHEATLAADRPARLEVDLAQAPARFTVEWFRAVDGATAFSEVVQGGSTVALVSPWTGQDVVVRLRSVAEPAARRPRSAPRASGGGR